MKYILFLFVLCCFLSWCSWEKKELTVVPVNTWSLTQDASKKIEEDPFSQWAISGYTIFWKNKHVAISSGYLTYGNTFAVMIPKEFVHWEYNNASVERFSVMDSGDKDFITFNADSTGWWRSEMSVKEICTPDYQEWINYKPKTIEKHIWDKAIYITYATFSLSSPDTPPWKNYQAEICFVDNGLMYTLLIWNAKKYRKDIVDSFTFL